MFKKTYIALLSLLNDDSNDSITILKRKQRADELKKEKLKAKLQLEEATHKWRVENLLAREQKIQETLTKLNKKQEKEFKIQQIKKELTERFDNNNDE